MSHYEHENHYNTFMNIGLLLCASISSVFHPFNTVCSIAMSRKLVALDRLNTIFGRKELVRPGGLVAVCVCVSVFLCVCVSVCLCVCVFV